MVKIKRKSPEHPPQFQGVLRLAEGSKRLILSTRPNMAIGPVESFKIESEAEADAYLKDLLAKPEHRSLTEVRVRMKSLIRDKRLQDYFVERANDR